MPSDAMTLVEPAALLPPDSDDLRAEEPDARDLAAVLHDGADELAGGALPLLVEVDVCLEQVGVISRSSSPASAISPESPRTFPPSAFSLNHAVQRLAQRATLLQVVLEAGVLRPQRLHRVAELSRLNFG